MVMGTIGVPLAPHPDCHVAALLAMTFDTRLFVGEGIKGVRFSK